MRTYKRYVERNTGTDLTQITPEVASAVLDQYVEEVVLAEYAASHGVEVPAEKIATAVRNEAGSTVIEKRDEMRRQKLISDITAEVQQPSEAEVNEYYMQHPAEFHSGEELHVRQILVHDEGVADEIMNKLQDTARSSKMLSSQYSLAPNAKKGGDIGYVSQRRASEDVRGRDLRPEAGQPSAASSARNRASTSSRSMSGGHRGRSTCRRPHP